MEKFDRFGKTKGELTGMRVKIKNGVVCVILPLNDFGANRTVCPLKLMIENFWNSNSFDAREGN